MASKVTGIKKQLEITTKRLNALREAYAIESSPNQKFTLEMQIAKLETDIGGLKKELERSYGLEMTTDDTLLHDMIRQMTSDVAVSEIHLVNCDREKARDHFWDAFDEKMEQSNRFQFYFLVSCPSQQPNSFSERMIYELIIEELEEEFGAINYVRKPDTRRVKVEDLPLGRNLRNSVKDFKKYFSERFGLGTSDAPFEEYLATGLPKLDYEYVATVFDLNASKWKQELMTEYLQWIIDTFNKTPDTIPTFIFFFVVFLKDAHIPNLPAKEQKLIEDTQKIVTQNEETATFIPQLPPVPLALLEDWIRDLGEHNQSKIDDMVKLIAAGLAPEKKAKYENQKILDMTDIERFQELVYQVLHQK